MSAGLLSNDQDQGLASREWDAPSGVFEIPPVPSIVETPTVSGAPPLVFQRRFWPQIPGFEFQAILGEGGMGIVYRVHHGPSNRTQALKIMHGGAGTNLKERRRFRAEARNSARLCHPHIARVFQIGEHDGTPYYSLEFLPGGTLEERLRDGPLPVTQAVSLIEQLARAVQAFHEAGILHRDLKPGNILFTDYGTPKITDFGLAKPLNRAEVLDTDGTVVGTPSYMAPEQTDSENPNQGPGVDIYDLGVILYQVLTGRLPFQGKDVIDVLLQVRCQAPVPPLRFRPDLPRDLNTICLKCLQKHPQDRYVSASALADDLRRFLENHAIRARATDWHG